MDAGVRGDVRPCEGRVRVDLLVLAGLLVFGAVFVVLARVLGERHRTRYELTPRTDLTRAETWVSSRLGTWRPVLLTGGPGPPPRAEAALQKLEAVDPALAVGGLLTVLGELAAESPGDARVRGWLGWARLLARDAAGAVAPLEVAAGEQPDRPEWHLLLGLALAGLERRDDALAAFRAGLSVDPDDPDLARAAAAAELAAGRPRDALPLAERAVGLARRWPEAQRTLARVTFVLGDYTRARRAFEDVLQLRPRDPEALARLSELGAR